MLRQRCFAGGALLVLALVAGSVSAPTAVEAQPEPSETMAAAKKRPIGFAQAKRRWERTRPDMYRVTVTQSCFCLDEVTTPRTLTVVGDEVIDVDPPIPDDIGFEIRLLTIDALFGILEDALANADEVVVRYNRQYGFPEAISIDWVEWAVDDEVSYTATSYQPLD